MTKIRAVLFDLDGVLLDAKDWHYQALNDALADNDCKPISRDDHLKIYDGLPTKTKLQMLTDKGLVPANRHREIYIRKQEITLEYIKHFAKPNPKNMKALDVLVGEGYLLACCSNAIRTSVHTMLEVVGLKKYFNIIISNQDVTSPKPNPEMYLKAMDKLDVKPSECLIVEDNEKGFKAAKSSGAKLMKVKSTKDVTYSNVIESIRRSQKMVNIVIPMAGEGSRFSNEGYKKPKPFIDVDGQPMIKRVIDCLKIPNRRLILIVRDEQYDEYSELLKGIIDDNTIIITAGKTEGQASTVLHAHYLINNDDKLVIVNSDQLIFEDINPMITGDSTILTFEDNSGSQKWSYAKVMDGKVVATMEKVPISNQATVGLYYFKHGKDFVDAALDMIIANDRQNVSKEFYVCPCFNYFIKRGGIVRAYTIDNNQWASVGTPELLKKYLRRKK